MSGHAPRRQQRFATASDDAGFWPVIRLPATTTWDCQSGPFENLPPFFFNMSSTMKGTTWVRPAASSSESAKPVAAFTQYRHNRIQPGTRLFRRTVQLSACLPGRYFQ
jgi:hypothetical protein